MKQKYRNILIFFMATAIFFVGAGVTVIDFCCSNCVENVFSMKSRNTACDTADMTVKDHSCCSSENSSNKDVSPCTSQHEGKCCEAERLSMDIDNRIFKPDLTNTFVSSFIHCYCCCFCHTDNIVENLSNPDKEDAVPTPPRDYLSLIRVLII